MRRSYYRRSGKSRQGGRVEAAAYLQEMRINILDLLLKGLAVIGAPTIVILLSRYIPRDEWGAVIFSASAYAWIIWITFDQKLPYRLRAVGLLAIPLALGVSAMIQEGITGSARIWLLGLSALATLFMGMNFGIGAITAGLLTLLGSAYLVQQGVIRPPGSADLIGSANIADWLLAVLIWLLIAVAISIAVNMLVLGLLSAIDKEKTLSGILTSDREQTSRRARELDRRLLQIRTAAEISRAVSALLDPEKLLQKVVDLVQDRFNLYFVGAYFLDEAGERAILMAGTGEAGKEMLTAGHKLAVEETSMVGWTIVNRQPRIALDVGREPVRFNNPLLPQTRSEMALPLISGEQIFGALSVQSVQPEAFDQDDIIVMQGIADSLAISLQNAQLFAESHQNLQEIQALNRQYLAQTWKKAGEIPGIRRVSYENIAYQGLEEITTTKQFPIHLRDQVIGHLSLDTDKKELTPDELTLVQEVTTQAALAMENIRLLEESQRRASLERLLSDVVQNVRLQTDLEMILRSTVGELGKALGATDGLIYLVPEYLEASNTPLSNSGNGGDGAHDEQS